MWSPTLLQTFVFAPRTVGTHWVQAMQDTPPCARVLEQEQLSWPKDQQQHPAGDGQRERCMSREGKVPAASGGRLGAGTGGPGAARGGAGFKERSRWEVVLGGQMSKVLLRVGT